MGRLHSVTDYIDGTIYQDMQKVDLAVKLLKIPGLRVFLRRALKRKFSPDNFVQASWGQLSTLIHHAARVATGPRMCWHYYPDSQRTEAVFLDELATALIEVGKAREITKDEALRILQEGRRTCPQLIAYVSGKPQELCNQNPQTCSLFKLQRHGIPAISKREL